ncbi:type IV toxin-antitoxin system AbiEi family antitoxin domain-containing protein [Streptomyces sp. HB132]|uniref:type IV toxin-antitoxin system AbiEi family antitoxin domain-containing protein n=1 Tax=Streptomyces sp. HB132 TaxID=767388 RepID=UPI00195F28FF|nr:type IV toxin-antitoxin system AbiEi family antitoxin domain-containing protein [Streptomyces sp. HB132]MBM7437342.1 very-short-patch-repair endonuclease [Streptomyces sp. HB132]
MTGKPHQFARGGVLLTREAVAAGVPARQLSRRLNAERWQRVTRGAWVAPGVELTPWMRARVVQILHPGLILSHRAAATLHRIELLRESIEFTEPSGLKGRRHGFTVHRTPLAPDEICTRDGLLVTTPLRTLHDLLLTGTRDEALVAVDSALGTRVVGGVRRRRVITIDTLAAACATHPTRRHGTPRAKQWLALTDRQSGSPAETIARLRMHDAGLHPLSQAELVTPDGRRVRPDFLFLREGVVVEIEGYAYHGSREAHRRDLARFNVLSACPGVRRVLRFPAATVFRTPDRMLDEIRAALAGASPSSLGSYGRPSRTYRSGNHP